MPLAQEGPAGSGGGFVLFYLIQRPQSAAGAVRTVSGAIGGAFQAIVVFFNSPAG